MTAPTIEAAIEPSKLRRDGGDGRLRGETHGGATDEARARVRRPLKSRGAIAVTTGDELRITEHRRCTHGGGGKWAEKYRCEEGRKERDRLFMGFGQSALGNGEANADSFSNSGRNGQCTTVNGASSV